MPTTLELHQALHGYSDGHRLISASLGLPDEARRRMLVMSDLSGPTIAAGFESYITGYPLPWIKRYALARTWYAQEMRRPGCAWTHTLLIRFSDLGKVDNPGALQRYFRRPHSDDPPDLMRSPLAVLPDTLDESLEAEFSWRDATALLYTLYGNPAAPVIFPSRAAQDSEGLVMRLWAQQWPGLRRAFSFSTGSLSGRTLGKQPLDLQVVPSTNVQSVVRETAHAVVVGPTTGLPSERWAEVLVGDLSSGGESKLRWFLRQFGADVPGTRETMVSMVELYDAVLGPNPKHEVSVLLNTVAKAFPEPENARHLKLTLFGPVESATKPSWAPRDEVAVLQALTTTPNYSVFEREDLAIRERARRVWKRGPDRALDLVVLPRDLPVNPLYADLLAGVSDAVTAEDVAVLVKHSPALIPALVNGNPLVAQSPALWRAPIEVQREVIDVLLKKPNDEIEWEAVVATLLDSGVTSVATDLVRVIGERVIPAVLDWVEGTEPQFLEEQWRTALREHPELVLQWLRVRTNTRPNTLMVLANVLYPHSSEVHELGPRPWLPLVEGSVVPGPGWLTAMVFALALGLDNPGDGADRLVAGSFQRVHDAAAVDRLTFSHWRMLQHQMPTLGWWSDWDKCEQLRRALADAFVRHEWPASSFLAAVKREDTLWYIVRYCNASAEGKRFLLRLREEADSHTSIPTWQRAVVAEATRRSSGWRVR